MNHIENNSDLNNCSSTIVYMGNYYTEIMDNPIKHLEDELDKAKQAWYIKTDKFGFYIDDTPTYICRYTTREQCGYCNGYISGIQRIKDLSNDYREFCFDCIMLE